MLTSLRRIIRWGWLGFTRNSGASVATTVIMIVVILLVSTLYLVQYTTSFAIESLEETISLTVFFERDTSSDTIVNAKQELTELPSVAGAEYISKEEALDIFSQRHEGDSLIQDSLATVGDNPLQAHINVRAAESDQYEQIAAYVENDSSFRTAVDHVNFSQIDPVVNKIEQITAGLTSLGIVLAAVFGVIAFLVAFNTVRLAIYSLREEISIMRLVGASNLFVRGPFLTQGVISGVIAAAVTFGLFAIAVNLINPQVEQLVPGVDLPGFMRNNILTVVALQLGTGVFLGLFASALALRRYLRS